MDDPTVSTQNTAVEPGGAERLGAFVGPFKLLNVLGEGGFGVVYEAEQTHPVHRLVALKVIKQGMDTREFVARFEAERQTLAALDHPHIAKVLAAGATSDGRPWFAMELVKGEPLNDYCDRHQLPIARRLEVFIQVCEAVQHAHDSGVVHRDLKPNNLIVATHDDRPFVMVIDFGIAKLTGAAAAGSESFTRAGEVIGTPAYMSPEQLDGEGRIDHRSDIYALGVVLYEVLIGSTPLPSPSYQQGGLAQVRRRLIETDLPRPSTRARESANSLGAVAQQRGLEPRALAQTLRGELDWIVMQALEREPARRYASARAVADDLRRYLGGQPVLAAPPRLGYVLAKRLRRHRTALSLLLLVGLLAVGLGIALWQLRGQVAADTARSLAVLPFRNLSANPDDAFFASGMHDAVLTRLSRIDELQVTSRSTVLAFETTNKNSRQIGDELGVALLLEGTVNRAGAQVRVSVNLIEAASDRVRWSDEFAMALSADNLFDIQAQITREIARQLGAELSAQENRAMGSVNTTSTEAYAAYLRGLSLGRYGDNTPDEIAQSIQHLDAAIAADPGFAAAHAAKAVAHMALAWNNRDRAHNQAQARSALDSARRLDPDSAETLFATGAYHYRVLLDYAGAETALAKALAIEPNNANAVLMRAAAARRDLRLDEASEHYRRARELVPLGVAGSELAITLGLAGRLDDAQAAAEQGLAVAPEHPYALGMALNVRVLRGELDAAWALARRLPSLDSGAFDFLRTYYVLYARDPAQIHALMATWPAPRQQPPFHDYFDLMRAYGLRQAGQADAARPLLEAVLIRAETHLAEQPGHDEARMIRLAALALGSQHQALRSALADFLARPPRDKLWMAEEGFVVLATLAIAGEHAAALDMVDALMGVISPAQFARIIASPAFDGLRTLPRYQALEQRYREWRNKAT